jgi:hypothetical protein
VSVCCVAANVERGLQEIFECEACSQCDQIMMSALPPKADIHRRCLDVRLGPKADISQSRFDLSQSPEPSAGLPKQLY